MKLTANVGCRKSIRGCQTDCVDGIVRHNNYNSANVPWDTN